MRRAKIVLETLTPLFIAGSEWEDISSEGLRAPSLRGQLRWWYRALIGGMVGSITEVKAEEENVFGFTEKKSKVTIRSEILGPREPIEYPAKGFCQGDAYHYVDYLFFSMKGTKRRRGRLYYEPGTKFAIELSSKDSEVDSLKKALCALWLAINLGGFGSRARRGAGSCCVSEFDLNGQPYLDLDDHRVEFITKSKTLEEYPAYIATNLKELIDYISSRVTRTKSPNKVSSFATLSQTSIRIFVRKKTFRRWMDVLQDAGSWLYKLRQSLADRSLSSSIKRGDFGQNAIFNENRVYLGLPMNYFFPKRSRFEEPLQAVLTSKGYERRSSPLWIGVSSGSIENYLGRICLFRSQFLPNFSREFIVSIKRNSKERQPININPQYNFFQTIETSLVKHGWVNVSW